MKARLVCLPIESIVEILKDYAGQLGFPQDATASRWLYNPAEGKMGLVVSADSLPPGSPPEEIKFQLKRVFGV